MLTGVCQTKWAIEYEEPAGEAFKLNHPEALMLINNCNVILRWMLYSFFFSFFLHVVIFLWTLVLRCNIKQKASACLLLTLSFVGLCFTFQQLC